MKRRLSAAKRFAKRHSRKLAALAALGVGAAAYYNRDKMPAMPAMPEEWNAKMNGVNAKMHELGKKSMEHLSNAKSSIHSGYETAGTWAADTKAKMDAKVKELADLYKFQM